MGGARSAPAAEEDVEADDEVDEADDAQAQGQAAVQGYGDDFDGRIERDAVAGDGVVDLAVGAGAVKGAFQVGEPRDRGSSHEAQSATPVSRSLAWMPATWPGMSRQNALGLQAAVCLTPPDAVVGLLEVALLLEIQDRQHEERGRGQGQQRRLHTVEETCLHGGALYIN